MKKSLVLALSVAMVICALTGCGSKNSAVFEKSEGVMTYDEYVAAPLDSEVTIEAFVQANQSWWDNTITLYTQDDKGAYFIYNMPCSEEDSKKILPGTKVKVTGTKSEWSGEVEIVDATAVEISDVTADLFAAKDVTKDLADEAKLKESMNQFVAFKGLTVEPADDNGAAFLYNWDGSGSQGDDLYFNVSDGTNTYSFTVESYLCDSSTDVYKAVEALNVGDKIDCEGFLYWYEGVNPHITKVTVK